MTYNFDPERWYLDRKALLEHRLKTGELDEDGYRVEVADLEQRYEELLERLDGTYEIPSR